MIGVGVIGCGYWGPNLIRALNEVEDACVARVADVRPGRRKFIEKRFPEIDTTSDAREILYSTDIDAVVVATPPEMHSQLAIEALLAGKHVFIEKPLATSSEDAEKIVETASRFGKSVTVGHLFLYAPAVVAIRSLLERGQLGQIYYISSTRANLGPPNAQMDVLWDLAPHDISIILDLLGAVPDSLEIQAGWFTNPRHAETAFLTMHFPGGRLAHIHVSWLTPNKTRILQLVCSERVVVYDDTQPIQKVQVFNSGVDNRVNASSDDSHQLVYGVGSIWVPALPNQEPLRAECEDFIRSIRDGKPPYSSGQKGLEVVRVLEWASRLLRQGLGLEWAAASTRVANL